MSGRRTYREHEDAVAAFLAEAREADPERYKEISEEYPTLSRDRWRTIRQREVEVGLLGLQPSHISQGVAQEYGLDSLYEEDDH